MRMMKACRGARRVNDGAPADEAIWSIFEKVRTTVPALFTRTSHPSPPRLRPAR